MNENNLQALLTLQATKGIGDVMLKKLIAHCGSAQEVLTQSDVALSRIDGIGKQTLVSLRDKENAIKAEKELNFIQKNQIKTWYFQDEAYPSYLKECIDAPVLLFTSGAIQINNPKIISIVGTRNITQQGIEFCNELIKDLKTYNPIIVSGFAYGVDITSHLAAMTNEIQTIGVLAHGLNQIYPKSHQKYVKQMNQNGGFITDYWSDSRPDRENFVKRNRIVAGISQATIVIESAEKGGSMITANLANDYSRDVFAVPGRTTDMYSQGCNKLIKINKAHLLTDVSDLAYLLNWDLEEKSTSQTSKKETQQNLDPLEKTIYDYLNQKGKTLLDEIAIDCNLPTFKLSSILLTMELKDVIRPLPGKLFEVK